MNVCGTENALPFGEKGAAEEEFRFGTKDNIPCSSACSRGTEIAAALSTGNFASGTCKSGGFQTRKKLEKGLPCQGMKFAAPYSMSEDHESVVVDLFVVSEAEESLLPMLPQPAPGSADTEPLRPLRVQPLLSVTSADHRQAPTCQPLEAGTSFHRNLTQGPLVTLMPL